MCLLAAGETMALDAAGRAAHEGVLQATFRRHKLPAALRATIVDFFVAKGWSVVDVPWDVDASDEAGWEAAWRAFLEDADVKGKSEAVARAIGPFRGRAARWRRSACFGDV